MLAYFDCFSGVSGDMTLGALFDLGVPQDWLKDQLHQLPLTDFEISVSPVQRHGIQATSAIVTCLDTQSSRDYAEIRSLIEKSPLADKVKSTGLRIFKRLAEAEARIHHCAVDQVHFHEVGGVDAIVDILGTALGLEYLGISQIVSSPIPLGKGFITCSHGNLPVPVPATVAILEGVPVYGTDVSQELVTPTGAAIIRSLTQRFEPMPEMVIGRIGYGAGQRDLTDRPNLLRIILDAGVETNVLEDQISIIETCIDDMNPELFGYLMDRLFEEGALDVYWITVQMKKNRPGTMLQVLCNDEDRDRLIDRVLMETTSIGVRYYRAKRRLLPREKVEVQTRFGIIPVKRIQDSRGESRLVPEYEVCRRIALEKNIPLRSVYDTIIRETAEMNDEWRVSNEG